VAAVGRVLLQLCVPVLDTCFAFQSGIGLGTTDNEGMHAGWVVQQHPMDRDEFLAAICDRSKRLNSGRSISMIASIGRSSSR
jgi:hypothetical protein